MNKLTKWVKRKRLERLIKRLYQDTAFWKVYFTVAEDDVTAIKELKKMKLEMIDDLPVKAFDRYLNYRIAIHLKYMNYASTGDLKENRAALMECLSIKDELNRVNQANQLSKL